MQYKTITLSNNKETLVDADVYDKLMSMGRWQAWKPNSSESFYATMGTHPGMIKMHRIIMGDLLVSSDQHIDHINGDTLDNRRSNLRVVCHADNMKNRSKHKNNKSGYKGVYFKATHNKWAAQIRYDGRKKHLGYFDTPLLAAIAYNEAAIIYHGEFARTNQIEAH